MKEDDISFSIQEILIFKGNIMKEDDISFSNQEVITFKGTLCKIYLKKMTCQFLIEKFSSLKGHPVQYIERSRFTIL